MLTAILLSVTAAAPTLAAPGFSCSGMSAGVCDAALEHFVATLSDRGVAVVTKTNVTEVLTVERQRQLLGCADDSSCLTELAGALGVGGILAGTVAKLESGFVATLKVIDGRDGRTTWTASARLDDERAFFSFLDEQSRRLADRLIPPAPPTPFVRFVPGIAGAALIVTGVALQVVAANDAAKLDAHIAGTALLSRMEIEAIAREGSGFQVLAAVSIGLGLAGIAGSIVWLVFGEKPVATVSFLPLPSGAAAAISWELP